MTAPSQKNVSHVGSIGPVPAILPVKDGTDLESDTIAFEIISAQQLDHTPAFARAESRDSDIFAPGSAVILQILPTGVCLTLNLAEPVVLGRQVMPCADNLIDLSQYKAYRHGISRHHCLLKRRGNELVVMDLGGTNGTFLNNNRLTSFVDHTVAHGDRLILGDMHINVFFSAIGRPQGVDE